jgi:cytochrome c556
MYRTKKTLVLVLSAICASGALAANPPARIVDRTEVVPQRSITQADAAALSRAAMKTLDRIGAARTALAHKDAKAARDDLRQADTLLDIIQAGLPTAQVREQIRVAQSKLKYEDTKTIEPDLVPIYSSLDAIEDFAAVPQARAHLDQARARLKTGDKPGAQRELDAVDAALLYQEADLPLAATRGFVRAAEGELARGKPQRADAHLKAAEDNVVVYTAFVDEPILSVRANLARAQRNYVAGRLEAAKADLGRAVEQLDRAAQRADASVKKDIDALGQDARSLAGRMDTHAAKDSHAAGRDLSLLWHRTRALADRTIDYTAVGWKRLREHKPVERSLIEARLHARYAEIDAGVGENPARAGQDLAEAYRYLEEARDTPHVAPAFRDKVAALMHRIDAQRQPGKAPDPLALRSLNAGIADALRSL